MGRLFTIGDSVSQGFRSGCTAFTEHAYSTHLARALGIAPSDYRLVLWEGEKLKFDLEALFRRLEGRFGVDVDWGEWPRALLQIMGELDRAETYFERGPGAIGKPVPSFSSPFTDNTAVEGMRVSDAWEITPALCKHRIQRDSRGLDNNFGLACANQPFYRAAYRVLNPQANDTFDAHSPIRWLEVVASSEGVDNLIVFLGANNALGTLFSLDVRLTPGNGRSFTARSEDPTKPDPFNLWHPNDFERDYRQLLEKICQAMASNRNASWKAYVGTVPLVTIAPIIDGFGEERVVKDPRVPPGNAAGTFRYYQYYKRYGVSDATALSRRQNHLTFRDAQFIDTVILRYNRIIKQLLAEFNQRYSHSPFVLVDIGDVLSRMAWKRNSGMPNYVYPEEFQWLYPPLNTKFYKASKEGELLEGGIFSLDGVHPTVIGQGIIAWEFLKAFQANGSAPASAAIDWPEILKQDELYSKPIRVLDDLIENDQVVDFFTQVMALLGR
ncbi:hypothetical protein KBZ19_12715 [Synechococcus sp. L2F]|uniref:hypothetical protein n=1 Tax=Synechococcus sp. L2F TaxID=2823739 RepID=UPI0020CF5835|nr:hypothetical protein [Synechococcus sp. L2F]MCP9829346.1 hypothetical protein [Synechococcus sp. L2F]